MKKAILLPNIKKDPSLTVSAEVAGRLSQLGIEPCLHIDFEKHQIPNVSYYSDPHPDVDIILVIGGDGSVIEGSRLAVALDVPLLGINLGKVGYLAGLDADRLDELSRLALGDFIVSDNMLLTIEKYSTDGSITLCDRLAVNDVVVCHDAPVGISDIKVENGRGDSVQYRADGVILATPAGSTAYSLSAGGPIISHGLDSITLTPVCPHSFFNRSIVYGATECLKITNMAQGTLIISVDGRPFDRLSEGEFCTVYKSERRARMISLDDGNLFTVLSTKIKLLHDLV